MAATPPPEETPPADPDHPQYGHGYQAGLAAGAAGSSATNDAGPASAGAQAGIAAGSGAASGGVAGGAVGAGVGAAGGAVAALPRAPGASAGSQLNATENIRNQINQNDATLRSNLGLTAPARPSLSLNPSPLSVSPTNVFPQGGGSNDTFSSAIGTLPRTGGPMAPVGGTTAVLPQNTLAGLPRGRNQTAVTGNPAAFFRR